MNSNTAIKILLSSAHFHGDAKALQHLADAQTQDMQADDLLLGPGAHQLHARGVLGLLFGGEHVVEHSGELGLVDFDIFIAEALAGLRLG